MRYFSHFVKVYVAAAAATGPALSRTRYSCIRYVKKNLLRQRLQCFIKINNDTRYSRRPVNGGRTEVMFFLDKNTSSGVREFISLEAKAIHIIKNYYFSILWLFTHTKNWLLIKSQKLSNKLIISITFHYYEAYRVICPHLCPINCRFRVFWVPPFRINFLMTAAGEPLRSGPLSSRSTVTNNASFKLGASFIVYATTFNVSNEITHRYFII